MPTCQQQDFSISSQKLSKAIILQKSESGWGDGRACCQTGRHLNVWIPCDPSGSSRRSERPLCAHSFCVFVFSH